MSSYDSDSSINDDYTDSSVHVTSRFYESIVDTTLAARERRRKRYRGPSKPSLQRNDYIKRVQDAIIDLSQDILKDWKDKVTKGSFESSSNANIFEYEIGDKYHGFPIVFLMNGPRDNSKFFIENGLFSVLEEVRRDVEYEGFRVSAKRVNKTKNVVNVDWKAGLYDAE